MGAKARQSKGKARLTAYEQLLSEANDAKRSERELEIAIPPGPRLGDQVIEVNDLRKGYGDRLLIEDLTFSLPRSGIVGIIGANGAGKTTLFRMLVGEEAPDAGSITIGDTVQLAYVDQSRDDLDAAKTVFQEITQGVEVVKIGAREVPARAYVRSFNFRGTDQQKVVGQLSGGERNRVHLAKLLQTGGNVLLLDEPTNDLDVDTLRALETGSESSPAASSSSATTAGSSTGSRRTSSPSRASRRSASSRATSATTRRSATRSSAPPPTSRTASSTSGSSGRRQVAQSSSDWSIRQASVTPRTAAHRSM